MARLGEENIDRAEWEASFARSIGRRSLEERRRRHLKQQRMVLLVPALAGVVVILVWIAQPLPYREYWWALVAIALVLPLVALWKIDLRDKDRGVYDR